MGYGFEHGILTKSICFPTDDDIIEELKKMITKIHARHVYIATDTVKSPRLQLINAELKKFKASYPQCIIVIMDVIVEASGAICFQD